ncbi:quinone oxidoreductase family protein [Coralloluteibacterium stylophorae]|uniref:Zinc-binding alcohol dehydrogenase family protein n=1 Tax=Coralloluteibacterium stylophorae TaxID=1776034 RepID=A0A8J8AZ02_9GAMM|nr:zinc-binding alcohol dehydrogenase family protein [Coralloluteibacterium stylophorae]MBS7456006.1 zinc-binding alcohol dehydrogenase family protein [Coralloluteibacterium stylophorae]
MKAAVVESFGTPPRYAEFREPVAAVGEAVVRVHAAPLSPIVRALAAGRHYTSAAQAGFVPGVDGVGTTADGRRVYFLFPKAPFGSLAERALVGTEMMVPVPDDLSDTRAVAVATGGLAAWTALSRRVPLEAGSTVLVNGASGIAGGMAVQIARHFGAGRVIAVGRNRARLERLDANACIALDEAADAALHAEFRRGVEVVLDFIWGEPGQRVITAATRDRASGRGEPRLRYVQLGNAAGETVALRADALRSSGLELLGCGIGSVAVAEMVAGARELLQASHAAGFDAPVTVLPLGALAEAWAGPPEVRYVLCPGDAAA